MHHINLTKTELNKLIAAIQRAIHAQQNNLRHFDNLEKHEFMLHSLQQNEQILARLQRQTINNTKKRRLRKKQTKPKLTYSIEGGNVGQLTRRRLPFALRVYQDEGPGLIDWSCVHFSTAASKTTLRKRVARLYPTATEQK